MVYQWFCPTSSVRLGKRTKLDDDRMIANWRTWSAGFVIDIRIAADRIYSARVDAFPLLYELLTASSSIWTKGEFDVAIGEGFWMEGKRTDDKIELKVVFEVGNDVDVLVTRSLFFSDALLFLVSKSGDIVRSLEELDVDVERSMSRFPVTQYKRGVW